MVSICSRAPNYRIVLQNEQDATPWAFPKKQPTMEYSSDLPQDAKPLRSCLTSLGNTTKAWPHWPERKCDKTWIRRQVRGKSKYSLDCLLSKWSHSRSAFPSHQHTSPPPPPTSGDGDELNQNTTDVRVGHHLWGDRAFIRTSLLSNPD